MGYRMESPYSLLIVEDDEGLNNLYRKTLQREGFHTESVFMGCDAISNAMRSQYVLILLDYDLPDMNGIQIIKTLKEKKYSRPFIVITGRGNEEIAIEMMKLGAQDYIIKGTDLINNLPGIVNRVINKLSLESKLADTEKALKRRIEELTAVHILSKKIGTNLLLENMVNAALEAITSIINPDFSILFIREKEDLLLQGVRAKNSKSQYGGIKTHHVGECLCGLAVSHRKSMFSKDIFSDPRCTWQECKKVGLRSFAALPLIINSELIGVLGIASESVIDFEERASFLEALAGQVAIGLQNSKLYENLKKHTN